MSLISIEVVDVQRNNEKVELTDLTSSCIRSLIWECKELLQKLKDTEMNDAWED